MASPLQRYRARRGKLPRLDRRQAVDDRREAVFPLGLSSGGGPIAWDPWGTDHPHCLVTGTTGSGKTRKLEEWALVAIGWGWRVTIIDFKGGGDFWAALSNGAELVTDPVEAIRTLRAAGEEIAERNAAMRLTPIERPDARGVMREDRATTYGDLPDEVREGCWLVIVDELASIVGLEIKGTPDRKATKTLPFRPGNPALSGTGALSTLVQLARSAGVHALLGIQRPDANMLPGFIKANVPSRILLGAADKEAEEMVLGSAITEHPERGLPRPTGTGFAVDIGGSHIVRFHASLLDRSRYLPFASPPGRATDPGQPGPGGPLRPDRPGASDRPAADALAPSFGGPSDPADSLTAASASAAANRPSCGSSAPPSAVLRIARAVRPVATGPFVRLALRAEALRNLGRPIVNGPFYRDPFLAAEARARDERRCRACGAGAPVEVDHRMPLMYGGEDELGNLRCLCLACHRAVTGFEMGIWRARRRQRIAARDAPGGYGLLAALRLAPLWLKVGLVLLVAGYLTGPRWGGYALVVLTAAIAGPTALRWLATKVPLLSLAVRPRGPGLDGVNNWDAEVEQDAARPGTFRHAATRATYGVKQGLFWNRAKLATMSGVFCLGWQAPLILSSTASLAWWALPLT
ncbi:MAG: HNH endonuclease [Chloroflexi bacterium]|nr:HNH endonuclease [Chloroflexota bacterium]